MTEFTQIDREILQETHKMVIELKVVLLGKNSDRGLVGKVNDLSHNCNDLEEKHNRLSKTLWILIGILMGSGLIGGGLWKLLR